LLLTLLLLFRTITGRGPAPVQREIPRVSAPPALPTHAAGGANLDPVPMTLTVRLYRMGLGPDDVVDLGRIGDPAAGPQAAAAVPMRLVVEAGFDEPLFPYLIAITPDGIPELQFPEAGSDPAPRTGFQYPRGQDYLELEQEGLLGLLLLGARRPLERAEILEMIRVDTEAWKRAETGVSWLFDGERCEPLVRRRGGGLATVSHGLRPLTELGLSLAAQPGIAAVRAVAFPVKGAPKGP
jgi:hypothetical protein